MSSEQLELPSSSPTQEPSRLCALLTSVLGMAAAQGMGCATAPVRPDPVAYLASCSEEARATPIKLKFDPEEFASFIESGTPASDLPIINGGPLNFKSGPVTAIMRAEINGKELETTITGEAVATPYRVYLQFNQLRLEDGTTWPICGVAVDDNHQYGIITHAKAPMAGTIIDPAMVDKSPGSVLLDIPRFDTVLQVPEGAPMPEPHAQLAPPDHR